MPKQKPTKSTKRVEKKDEKKDIEIKEMMKEMMNKMTTLSENLTDQNQHIRHLQGSQEKVLMRINVLESNGRFSSSPHTPLQGVKNAGNSNNDTVKKGTLLSPTVLSLLRDYWGGYNYRNKGCCILTILTHDANSSGTQNPIPYQSI
jgi:hypothetical protein